MNRLAKSCAHVALATTVALGRPVKAQSPEQLLRGILNQATRQGQSAPMPVPGVPPSTGMVAAPPPMQAPPGSILWPNKQAFLDATRSGALANVYRANRDEKSKLVHSIAHILYTEYQVPPIPQSCNRFETDVVDLLGNIAEGNMATLSDRGPDFVAASGSNRSYGQMVDSRVRELQTGSDFCDQRVMGQNQPHPYKAALINLMREYSQVMREYVNVERDRRKALYAQAQQAELDRQAAARAAEQQKVDAEAARIRADEQRRAQKERARVGG